VSSSEKPETVFSLVCFEGGLQTSTDTDTKQYYHARTYIFCVYRSLEDHEKTLISVVRKALIDSDEEAEKLQLKPRLFATKCAVDQVLPHLLNLLRTEGEAENALSALLRQQDHLS
jgi:hypothetical protein